MNPSNKSFHGWAIAGSCFIILLCSNGIVGNIAAVFQTAVSSEMGWSRAELSAVIAVGMLPMIVAPLLAGVVTDMFGARKTTAGWCLFSGVGTVLLGGASRSWHFALLLAAVGLAVSVFIPIVLILVNWFARRRGLVIGLVLTGTFIGDAVRGKIITFLLASLGWRISLAISGAISLLVTLPLVFFVIRDRPSETGLSPHGGEPGEPQRDKPTEHAVAQPFRSSTFWLIAAGVFLIALANSPVSAYSVKYLEGLGHSFPIAGSVFSTGLMILGAPMFGLVADKWGVRKAFVVSALIIAAGVATLMLASPLWVLLLVFVVFYGLFQSGPLVLTPLLAADYHGLSGFGITFGLLTLFNGLGGSIGSAMVGVAHSAAVDNGMTPVQGYRLAFVPLIFVALVSAYCISRIKLARSAA